MVALVVMARSPRADPAAIKTRLTPVLPSAEDRRQLYVAFLADTLAMCQSVRNVTVRVAYAPRSSRGDFAELGLSHRDLVEQIDGDLGARERGVFDALFSEGLDRVVMIGSDLPTLPAAHVTRAIAQVAVGAVVLGPSEDGGYYLMGLAGPHAPPALFEEVRWSTRFAFEDTVRAARRAELDVRLAPSWHDVDEPADLERLRQELKNPEIAARAPATSVVLDLLGLLSHR